MENKVHADPLAHLHSLTVHERAQAAQTLDDWPDKVVFLGEELELWAEWTPAGDVAVWGWNPAGATQAASIFTRGDTPWRALFGDLSRSQTRRITAQTKGA